MAHSIWYVGGKSAGHIIPLMTLAADSSESIVYITTHRQLDARLIKSSTKSFLAHCRLYLPDMHTRRIILYPWYLILMLRAFIKLWLLHIQTAPKKIISTGGLCALPVFLYARCVGISCELFELNAVPGSAVKALIPLSSALFYCYKSALTYLPSYKAHYRAYPIRISLRVSKCEALSALGLDSHKKTICFLGGSQGSSDLNRIALRSIMSVPVDDIQVIHQTGSTDLSMVTQWYGEKGYTAHVIDFSDSIHLLYSAADMVVCRAGAGTLWELAYLGIPTAIIPLKTAATDHQIYNAQALCAEKPDQYIFFLQEDIQRDSLPLIRWIKQHSESYIT